MILFVILLQIVLRSPFLERGTPTRSRSQERGTHPVPRSQERGTYPVPRSRERNGNATPLRYGYPYFHRKFYSYGTVN